MPGPVFSFILVAITSAKAANGFASTAKRCGSAFGPLFGYQQVGDYLSSFNSDPNDEDEEGERNEGEYIGHGRVRGNGGEEGGIFDVNNYFASFDSASNPIENAEETGVSPAYGEASSFLNFEIGTPPTEETPELVLSHEEIFAYNNARLCPKNLLTQRAIQSFMFLCEECRDPHSGEAVWQLE